MSPAYLTAAEVEHFLERGFVTVKGCFTRQAAQKWLDTAWVRFGVDPEDPATWSEQRIHLSPLARVDVAEFAPRAFGAACQLAGGADRIRGPWSWSDSFIANLGFGADRPWDPPSARVGGWHKDGDFFRHFLDSPEQGLLTFVLWSDIEPRGGGTFVAADSVPVVARTLAEHPEGVLPDAFDFAAMVGECHDFVETTGELGDVVLLHPYVLHAVSQNVLGTARLITNPPLTLAAPMRFDRPDDADLSPVERGVLRGLGVDRYPFVPAAAREEVVPERVRLEAERQEEEERRLSAAGLL
jgi:hypothetical protein